MRHTHRSTAGFTLLLLFLLYADAPGARADPREADAAKRLSLDDLYGSEIHDDPDAPEPLWIENGAAYLLREESENGSEDWYRYELHSDQRELWLAQDAIRRPTDPGEDGPGPELEVEELLVAPGERHVLLLTDRTKRWRHSHSDVHWIHDRESGRTSLLSAAHTPQFHAAFSPDGRRVGFVAGGDLYLHELHDGSVRALTEEGGPDIQCGDPDWVYEEELDFEQAWWWSPSGRSIAYLRFESAAVPHYPMIRIGDGSYPDLISIPYPKAGESNSEVELRVVDIDGGASIRLAAVGNEAYLARVGWTRDEEWLSYQLLSRDQRRLELFKLPAGGGESRRLLLEEREAWIDVHDDLYFLKDGAGFLWRSDRTGFDHLYLYGMDGGAGRRLTEGSWSVLELIGVDDSGGNALVLTDRGNPLQRHLERVFLDDGSIARLSSPGGWHTAKAAPGGRYYVETASTPLKRPRVVLRDGDGREVRVLLESDMEDLAQLRLGSVRYLQIPNEEGDQLSARLITPPDFDETRRYPVIVYCYGGPGSQLIRQRWGGKSDLFHHVLANDGFLVFTVDGRGTRGHGRVFQDTVYRRLGQFEVEDQAAGARYLAQLPYVDPQRIAIWGWSYGGYLSALTLLKAREHFAAAASVAPVADWSLYDTIYTERYMGTPQDNAEGYRAGSVLEFVDRLEAPLLLLHGSGDDNVHPQNTMRLVSALQQEGKDFEMMFYPDESHGVRGDASMLHLRRQLRRFFHRVLQPEGPPVDLSVSEPEVKSP